MEVAFFVTRCIGNHGNLDAPSVGVLGKCRDMSEVVEVDLTNRSMVLVVEPTWLHQFLRLASDDNVMR